MNFSLLGKYKINITLYEKYFTYAFFILLRIELCPKCRI
jgi:hypothetical protein